MMEIDPILRKEFGRNLFHAAVQAGGVDDFDGDDKYKDNEFGNKEDGESDKEESAGKGYDDENYAEQSDKVAEEDGIVAPMPPTEDDAFEVVGDLYDFDVSGYAGCDHCSDGEEY
jgi:hypothetical protein